VPHEAPSNSLPPTVHCDRAWAPPLLSWSGSAQQLPLCPPALKLCTMKQAARLELKQRLGGPLEAPLEAHARLLAAVARASSSRGEESAETIIDALKVGMSHASRRSHRRHRRQKRLATALPHLACLRHHCPPTATLLCRTSSMPWCLRCPQPRPGSRQSDPSPTPTPPLFCCRCRACNLAAGWRKCCCA